MSALQPVQGAAAVARPDKRVELREAIHDSLNHMGVHIGLAMTYAELGDDLGLRRSMRTLGLHMSAALVDYEELLRLRKAALNG